jgi:hypothetical protein
MSFSRIEHKVVHGYLFKIYTLSAHFAIDAFFLPCFCLVCSSEISRFQQLLSAEGQSGVICYAPAAACFRASSAVLPPSHLF